MTKAEQFEALANFIALVKAVEIKDRDGYLRDRVLVSLTPTERDEVVAALRARAQMERGK